MIGSNFHPIFCRPVRHLLFGHIHIESLHELLSKNIGSRKPYGLLAIITEFLQIQLIKQISLCHVESFLVAMDLARGCRVFVGIQAVSGKAHVMRHTQSTGEKGCARFASLDCSHPYVMIVEHRLSNAQKVDKRSDAQFAIKMTTPPS